MAAISDVTTSALWVPTADLGYSRPYGMASDLNWLYVSCWGTDGTDGAIVRVNQTSKAVELIADGLNFPKHGMDWDSAGNLLYVTGPNGYGAGLTELHTLWKWDGATSTDLYSDQGMFSLVCDRENQLIYTHDHHSFQHKNTGHHQEWLMRLAEDGTFQFSQDTGGPSDFDNDQHRGLTLIDGELVAADKDGGALKVRDPDTGGLIASFGNGSDFQSIHVYGLTDGYALDEGGGIYRFNLSARTIGTQLTHGMPTTGGINGYGDIHITPAGRCFVTRGGLQSHSGSTSPNDLVGGTDAGIYELVTNVGFVPPPASGEPTVTTAYFEYNYRWPDIVEVVFS